MNLYPIIAGNFMLDGGAMFGVVPKSIWQKTNPADSNNMIQMAARCLLVEDVIHQLMVELLETFFSNSSNLFSQKRSKFLS